MTTTAKDRLEALKQWCEAVRILKQAEDRQAKAERELERAELHLGLLCVPEDAKQNEQFCIVGPHSSFLTVTVMQLASQEDPPVYSIKWRVKPADWEQQAMGIQL